MIIASTKIVNKTKMFNITDIHFKYCRQNSFKIIGNIIFENIKDKYRSNMRNGSLLKITVHKGLSSSSVV